MFFSVKIPVVSAETINLGILGDSNTDEYRADDNRAAGTPYQNTTLNWAELLVNERNVNLGTWGTWGEPRRSGYKYNWTRSGATSTDMISSGQHTGLAQQIRNGEVQYVIIFIGSNDFNTWNGTYNDVYSGNLSDAQVQQKVNTIISNITQAVSTVQAAGNIKLIVANYSDPGMSVDFRQQFPDATKRQRITNAIVKINQGINDLAQSKQFTIADLASMATSLLSNIDATGNVVIGGEKIIITSHGNDPHHLQLDDSVGHSGTVGNGIIANVFIRTLNTAFNTNVAVFSDQEILTNAGIMSTLPTPTSSIKTGDANGDNVVNGADYILWLNNYQDHTTLGASKGDFNADGVVNGTDFVVWLTNYGH